RDVIRCEIFPLSQRPFTSSLPPKVLMRTMKTNVLGSPTVSGRFSCVRSMRKSLLHKAPADFSTASGENSGAGCANAQQELGGSVMPTGAPVAPWRQAHRPMQACHTGAPEWVGYRPETPSSCVVLAFKATCGQ